MGALEKIIRIQEPYPLQEEIESDPTRFRVVDCGRRWGKSLMAMREAFNMAVRGYLKTGRKQRGWIVSPTFPLVREDWIIAENMLKDAITKKLETQMKMEFGAIGFIEFKSAEREDEGLRGAGLDFAVLDEASRITRKSWEQGIRPALADKQGRALFISTPKGRNWFYDLFMKGKSGEKDIKSWQHPTYTNPYFPKAEWERVKETTPELILRQEYEADFLEDEATVFKNIDKCLGGFLQEPIPNDYYTFGIDLGKAEDFTVITVIHNKTLSLVDIYRMREVDWSLQKAMIKAMATRFKKHIAYIDSTGLGNPIEEDLRKSGVNTKDYKFTNQSKQEIIEQLTVAIEQGFIRIPDCPKTRFLIDELKAFTYEILPSGRIRYSAPEGLHDDGVISLGLAIRGLGHLFYKKPPQEKPKPKAMQEWTADEWERFYNQIDSYHRRNPNLTRGQAIENLKYRRMKSLVQRAING